MPKPQRPTSVHLVHSADKTAAPLPDRYLKPEDLVELFDLPSVETVYQWRRKRTGPPGFRVGRHLRYDPAEVAQWVAAKGREVA
ncbi:helix-turn-helix protein [Kitasatospora sp. SolWspMP-SS2h]|uniref:helix-turn-helix transcriptional regulator n=1 Tax=Kitasatospora sp. SolWspMP-SS2h TaxID=1305729 RepID=UPI000DBA1E5D|nr:helix-turn-helix domain-containing protein [Kitasatospora sp. SolWspMP-SS2h]RAJ42803.1 helix-turn-helix protein [Kitasatospora sp. SolWspMP-SS2h]